MIRNRKTNEKIYTTNINEQKKENDILYNDNKNYNDIETLVFSSSEMYIISILGYIDKLLINNKININNIKNYVSSSFGTIVSVYLSFGYKPKEIVEIFFKHLIFVNDDIFNIKNTFGIFKIKDFVDNLLQPLYSKLGFIPTLTDIYRLTNKNCLFISYNFTRSKTIIFTYKTYPKVPINELIQKCCIIPFIFKKYTSDVENEDLYVDYSLVDEKEYDYSIYIFKKSKKLLLKVNILYKENDENISFIENKNIFEYTKQLFDAFQIREKENIDLYEPNIINIEIYKYNKALLFDKFQRFKEIIYLYCNWFEKTNNNINNNINDNSEKENKELKHDKYDIENNFSNNYNGIVISGGGTNVFSLLGCIKYCLEHKIINLNEIDTYIATSAGSYLCTLLALNFNINDAIELYVSEITDKFNINIKNINISDRINEMSLYSNKLLINIYESMFIKYNDGQIPSLLDIKNNYGKELVYTVFNLNKNKLEYLNYKNSPELLVTQACAMSSCVPYVFNPIKYKNYYYVDGGLRSNFSIEKTKDYLNKKFIGFGLKFSCNYVKMNLFEFGFYYIMENGRKYQITKINNSMNCDTYCVHIVFDDERDNASFLSIDKNKLNRLIDKGYKYIENELKK